MSLRSKRAFATVEFALILPLLLLFVAAAINYAMLMRNAIAVADAARAGAQFGSINLTNAANTSAIESNALDAAPDVANLTVTAAKTCQCSTGTVVSCSGGTCSSGAVRTYVQVTAKTTVSALFSFSIPYTGAVISTATMRAQ